MNKYFPYLLIGLILCFSEEADVLDESGLNVFIVHKLAKDVKFLPQELVGEIHLMEGERRSVTSDTRPTSTSERASANRDAMEHMPPSLQNTHRGVHNACAMRPDGVGNVTDVNGVQVLVVACLLYEDLFKGEGCI